MSQFVLTKLEQMELIWVMFSFFIIITILFIVLAVTFPEWFGITGNKALDIQKHQKGDQLEPTETINNSKS